MSSTRPTELSADEMRAALGRLLNRNVTAIERIGGGRNSQIYKVTTDGAPRFALKAYFRHAADNRNRLATEFGSFFYLWKNGFREIPEPIVADHERGWAVYQFIEGEKIPPGEADEADVNAFVDLLGRLRELSRHPDSRKLGAASEAFFAVGSVAENVRQRLERLRAAAQGSLPSAERCAQVHPLPAGEGRGEGEGPGHAQTGISPSPFPLSQGRGPGAPYQALREFLDQDLSPLLERVIRWSEARLQSAGMSFTRELAWEQRTLSPSDCGFHNALRQPDGRIIFLDFEYFGWDDPAKMISDFLLHPAMELPAALKRKFASAMLRRFPDFPALVGRVESVYPLFGLKWCLILLNEFVSDSLQRRQFAAVQSTDRSALQMQQLDKARRMLNRIRGEYEQFPYRD